jgi:hypothetical protein
MHLACHMRPNGNFFSSTADAMPRNQKNFSNRAVLRRFRDIRWPWRGSRPQDMRLPQIETAAIGARADCGARRNPQGLPVFWTGPV